MRSRHATGVMLAAVLLFEFAATAMASEPKGATEALSAELRQLKIEVARPSSQRAEKLRETLEQDVRRRLREANRQSSQAWRKIDGKEAWIAWKTERIAELKRRLAVEDISAASAIADGRQTPKSLVTSTHMGDGYAVENLVFESRPGLVVTANLYRPEPPRQKMPGILISHSHHRPKEQSELQDMGIGWARVGCLVLVMDHLGHGERRQHEFRQADDYPGEFRLSRQDYYFRYNLGLQLPLAGETLMGWLVHDLRRGVDLLLDRPGIDGTRIVLLGAVAGGGDPAAVTAAVDERIAAAAPFNFGGPQPETRYPLPDDAEATFNYAGGGSWESTRNLHGSAAGGYLPWVIVGSLAPRGLVYGHEFVWDRERDPVWARLQKIYGWFEEPERLAFAHGHGRLSGQPPESSHCTNIGRVHRQGIYDALDRWFGIPRPARENSERLPEASLACLTEQARKAFQSRLAHELAAEPVDELDCRLTEELAVLETSKRRDVLRKRWRAVLGEADPRQSPERRMPEDSQISSRLPSGASVERFSLEVEPGVEPGIEVPVALLLPARANGRAAPVVVAVAQQGKQALLAGRTETIAELLERGVAVCLPDVRGTGETRAGDGRGRTSGSTSLSASEWMLGQTLLGGQLRDLCAVLEYLRTRDELDLKRLALWGDSLSQANPAEQNMAVPLDAELPRQAEPLGGLLALLGGLFEDEVRAVYVQGGLTGYRTVLDSRYCYVPHDALVPRDKANWCGDLCHVAAALAPRPLRLEALVDGRNRRVPAESLREVFKPASDAYAERGAAEFFELPKAVSSGGDAAEWLAAALR